MSCYGWSKRLQKYLLCLALCVGFSSCMLFYRTSIPIKTQYHQSAKKSDILVVFLPGRGSSPDEFLSEGLVEILKKTNKPVDSVAVDAHPGYYMKRSLLTRLKQDVIAPARARGYKKIWLVGISMGGLGSLLFAQKHHDLIDGILLMAPFLGDKDLINEISKAGGLVKWSPGTIKADDYQRALWKWLKNYTDETKKMPPLYIGYGSDDRFAHANSLLAQVLLKSHCAKVVGGHDWGPWRLIFRHFVTEGVIQ